MKPAKGLVLIFTGDGKGKTTAAFGVALRALGHGGRVGVVQFLKGTTHNAQCATKRQAWSVDPYALHQGSKSGELESLKKFGSKFKVWTFGGGFTWSVAREVNARAVTAAWQQCKTLLRDPRYTLVIFDEIHVALKYNFLETSQVVKALKKRPPSKHVILTGRGAPAQLIQGADLVTEMKCVRHPFKKGVRAQRGIEF
ncbi:MAG: cob(I)yrinic acid a,c-diamide adenosyltransferase [Candidatus Omnitrophica bacterium]|nr:cob(I)yrinic acid a,c-diamide adenosyltransferase [Candidatus Omnitrophota bacterium]